MREPSPIAPRSNRAFALGLLLVASGCSPGKTDQAPTEEQIHQSGAKHPPHRFICQDGGAIIVDFENSGLAIRIRQGSAAPVVLTAPASARPFVGAGITATIEDHDLKLIGSNGSIRTCLRQSKG